MTLKCPQPCCLGTTSGSRAVVLTVGFALCPQPGQPPYRSMETPSLVLFFPPLLLLKMSVKVEILSDYRSLCGPWARASAGRTCPPPCPCWLRCCSVGLRRPALQGAFNPVQTVPGKSRRGERNWGWDLNGA